MRINSITIGSFTATANDPNLEAGGNNLKPIQGLESPSRRVPNFALPSQHGAFVSNALYGARTLIVPVEIIGSSEADFQARIRLLSSALDLETNPKKTLSLTDASGDTYEVKGYATVISGGSSEGRRTFDTVIFNFLIEDFRINATPANSQVIPLEDTSGGVTIPTAIPISFGAGIGGSATITNAGAASAYPTIRLANTLTNPTIINVTTGKTFKYESSIAAGEYIDIDMAAKTVVNQAGANKLPNVSISLRDFWSLQIGANVIEFIHEGAYNTNAKATITWNDAYLTI